MSASLPSTNGLVTTIQFLSDSLGWAVAATNQVFRTTNGGATWMPQNTVTTNALRDVHFSSENTGWAVGDGGTILTTENGGVTFVANTTKTTLPQKFTLEQNYPNPFNPSTSINFSIPKAGFVSLKVYDILGKEVTTLLRGYKDAGSYTVNFNAANFSSGVYLYKLEANGFALSRKMILTK